MVLIFIIFQYYFQIIVALISTFVLNNLSSLKIQNVRLSPDFQLCHFHLPTSKHLLHITFLKSLNSMNHSLILENSLHSWNLWSLIFLFLTPHGSYVPTPWETGISQGCHLSPLLCSLSLLTLVVFLFLSKYSFFRSVIKEDNEGVFVGHNNINGIPVVPLNLFPILPRE